MRISYIISGFFTYMAFVYFGIRLGLMFLILTIILYHLANIHLIHKFYYNVLLASKRFLLRILDRLKKFLQKLYLIIRFEFIYRFLQVLNIFLVFLGFFLLLSGLFDPEGVFIYKLLHINFVKIFVQNNNYIFEILFGFSIIMLSIVLYIIISQNKKKLGA
jgi:hypothetical protein